MWLAVTALFVGFVLGRARLDRIVNWAEDWTAPGWHTWRFWLAVPFAAAALATVWIVHPRRTLANVRSWRAGERLHPAPQRDPNWEAKRRSDTGARQDGAQQS